MSSKWALLAPGESLTQGLVDSLRGKLKVMCVGNTYELAPWADAMCHNDAAWWRKYPQARLFGGLRFTTNPHIPEAKRLADYDTIVTSASNSGVLGIYAAFCCGATEMYLFGFDMRGSHFAGMQGTNEEGAYKNGLKNTTPERFKTFMYSYERLKRELCDKRNVKVWNCNPDSALKAFPKLTPEEAIARIEPCQA